MLSLHLFFFIFLSLSPFLLSLTPEEHSSLASLYRNDDTQFYSFLSKNVKKEFSDSLPKIFSSTNHSSPFFQKDFEDNFILSSPSFYSFLTIVSDDLSQVILASPLDGPMELQKYMEEYKSRPRFHYNTLFLNNFVEHFLKTVPESLEREAGDKSLFLNFFYAMYHRIFSQKFSVSFSPNPQVSLLDDFSLHPTGSDVLSSLTSSDSFTGSYLEFLEENFIMEYTHFLFRMNKANSCVSLLKEYLLVVPSHTLLFNLASFYLPLGVTPPLKMIFSYFETKSFDIFSKKLQEITDTFSVIIVDGLKLYDSSDSFEEDARVLKRFLNRAAQSPAVAADMYAHKESLKDASYYNNLALFTLRVGDYQRVIEYLKKAETLDPSLFNVKVNFAIAYLNSGNMDGFHTAVRKLQEARPDDLVFPLLQLLCHRPVPLSWAEVVQCKEDQVTNAQFLLERVHKEQNTTESSNFFAQPIPEFYSTNNFFITYNGLNNRRNQELLAELETDILRLPLPHPQLLQSPLAPQNLELQVSEQNSGKLKIGFISSIFKVLDPHALLLSGLIRHLPRENFEVSCFFIGFERTNKVIDFSMLKACDEKVMLGSDFTSAHRVVHNHALDFLVIADSLCENINHLFTLTRVAPVQILFWGNPETSGSHKVDYFLSAPHMEHPYAGRISETNLPYTEQIVLLDGQGIFYEHPAKYSSLFEELVQVRSSPMPTRESISLTRSDFVFFVPQNIFKIHPLFDGVIQKILEQNPGAQVVMLKSDDNNDIFIQRIRSKIPTQDLARLHFVSRCQPQDIYDFIDEFADVVLHPFPFDGSKTSLDALYASKPFITLPSEFLRGRMALSYLRSMNLPELYASDIFQYLAIAKRLYSDPLYYRNVVAKISENKDLAFEDMLVPHSFNNFLLRVAHRPLKNLEDFVRQSSNTQQEYLEYMAKIQRRHINSLAFDSQVSKQEWMLSSDRTVHLDDSLKLSDVPKIFRAFYQYLETEAIEQSTKEEGFRLQVQSSKWISSQERQDLFSHSKKNDFYSFFKGLAPQFQSDPLYYIDGCFLSFQRSDYHLSAILCYNSINHDYNPSISYQLLALSCFYADMNAMGSPSLKSLCYPDGNRYNEAEKYLLLAYHFYRTDRINDFLLAESRYNPEPLVESNPLSVLKLFQDKKNKRTLPAFYFPPVVKKQFIFISYLNALVNNHKYNTAIRQFLAMHNLRPINLDDLVIFLVPMLFSVLDIDLDEHRLQSFYLDLLSKHNIPFFKRRFSNFRDMVLHFQSNLEALSVIYRALLSSSDLKPIVDSILVEIHNLIRSFRMQDVVVLNSFSHQQTHLPSALPPKKQVSLIVQYYRPKDPKAQINLDLALQKNIYNAHIDKIFLLTEESLSFDHLFGRQKIQQIVIGKRMSFKDAFSFANTYLNQSFAIIANADIFFDDSLQFLHSHHATKILAHNGLFSLTKWIASHESPTEYKLEMRIDSQDAWIFQAPLSLSLNRNRKPEEFYAASNFHLGLPRCDGRINSVLSDFNVFLFNIPYDIKAYEESYHEVERTGDSYSMQDQVSGEIVLLPFIPSLLHHRDPNSSF